DARADQVRRQRAEERGDQRSLAAARAAQAPDRDDDARGERSDEEHEAHDAELAERLEIEGVRVLDEVAERAVLQPPGSVRAGAPAVERRALELVQRRGPELPPAAPPAAEQMLAARVAGRQAPEVLQRAHRP